jgi:hypothetical protein
MVLESTRKEEDDDDDDDTEGERYGLIGGRGFVPMTLLSHLHSSLITHTHTHTHTHTPLSPLT